MIEAIVAGAVAGFAGGLLGTWLQAIVRNKK